MPVRLLVTGVQGQLARSLVERATSEIAVLCTGRPELDLEKAETIERAVRVRAADIVIGAAAYTAVDRAEDEPDLAYRINGEAAGILAGAARRCGARMLFVSTDYVYNGRNNTPYVETDATDPQ